MNIKISEAAERLQLKPIAGQNGQDGFIKDVYVCDLLSWVMGRAPAEGAWITIQGHVNIIAVALLTEVSCIIIAENAEIDQATIDKANDENIPLFSAAMTSYELAVKLSAIEEN